MTDRVSLIRTVLSDHGRLGGSIDGIADSDNLYEAGLTSHASVNVMLALEDAYDIEFPEEYLKRSTFESIDNLRMALDELLGVDV